MNDAIVGAGYARQPGFELLLQVRKRCLFVDQLVNTLRGELTRFLADEGAINIRRVTIGVLQLRLYREVLVFGDADDKRVAPRNLRSALIRRLVGYFVQISLLLSGAGVCPWHWRPIAKEKTINDLAIAFIGQRWAIRNS